MANDCTELIKCVGADKRTVPESLKRMTVSQGQFKPHMIAVGDKVNYWAGVGNDGCREGLIEPSNDRARLRRMAKCCDIDSHNIVV